MKGLSVGMSVEVRIANEDVLRAVVDVLEALEAMHEEEPWREDVRVAMERMRYVAENVKMKAEEL